MKFALGEDHGVVITTPADFPDPAPDEATLEDSMEKNTTAVVGNECNAIYIISVRPSAWLLYLAIYTQLWTAPLPRRSTARLWLG